MTSTYACVFMHTPPEQLFKYSCVCVCLFVCLCVGYFRGLTGSSCLVTQLRVHTAFMEVSVCVLCAVWWSI